MFYQVNTSSLSGNIVIPPSKSHTLRAILFASLASGKSTIHNYLLSPDTTAMINACQLLGAKISVTESKLMIDGTSGKPRTPADIIDSGNSGQVLRFVAAVAALTDGYTVLTGDHSIKTNRPIQPLLDGLTNLGVMAVSAQNNGYAPIIIRGPLQAGTTTLNGEDSQPVSGLLIAAAFANGTSVINVENPGETPWIELTLAWFKRLSIDYKQINYTQYTLRGNAAYSGFEYVVPGDFSSAAFPLVAALVTRSEITISNLDMQDVQGDKALIFCLQQMGANLEFDADKKCLIVKNSGIFSGKNININDYIDALPILTVMACFAKGETRISGAAIARRKECDRLSCITKELSKMGACIIEHDDALTIQPGDLVGARVHSHNDHRIAMALVVAGLAAKGETTIELVKCVDKSFPNFAFAMQKLGASIT
jgi:3-phosphoshikimate 1-carboxyvinyltransferase